MALQAPVWPEVAEVVYTPPPIPIAAQGAYQNPYAYGNCTQYVAGRIKVPDNLGNANTWAVNAAAQGYEVSATPIVGAVGATTRGYYGHVVVVLAVGDGQVYISEANVLGLGVVDSKWEATSDFTYIYFR